MPVDRIPSTVKTRPFYCEILSWLCCWRCSGCTAPYMCEVPTFNCGNTVVTAAGSAAAATLSLWTLHTRVPQQFSEVAVMRCSRRQCGLGITLLLPRNVWQMLFSSKQRDFKQQQNNVKLNMQLTIYVTKLQGLKRWNKCRHFSQWFCYECETSDSSIVHSDSPNISSAAAVRRCFTKTVSM